LLNACCCHLQRTTINVSYIPSSFTLTLAVQSEVAVVPSSWKQQGETIVGDGAFGWSVALSADASTIAIGNHDGWEYAGYVQVFHTDNDTGNTVQIGLDINGDAPGDNFGESVDISADGKTIICASRSGNGITSDEGHVRVFSLEGDKAFGSDTWKQIGQDIIDSGQTVSISKDGKMIAAGPGAATFSDTLLWDLGPVRIHRLVEDGMSWEQIGEDIAVGSHGGLANSGVSLSLSADGSTIVIGESYNNANGDESGQVTVYRFENEGGHWERLGQSIYGDNTYDRFGTSVHLSYDGNTLAIGSPNKGSGYVRVYSLASDGNIDTDTWKQIAQDIVGETNGDNFGWSVSLSDDGRTLAVGAHLATAREDLYGFEYELQEAGLVKVYRLGDLDSVWVQLGDAIEGEDSYDKTGHSVSLSGDGNKVVIGSPGILSGYVRAFVFK